MMPVAETAYLDKHGRLDENEVKPFIEAPAREFLDHMIRMYLESM
jgi:hypothetical protein